MLVENSVFARQRIRGVEVVIDLAEYLIHLVGDRRRGHKLVGLATYVAEGQQVEDGQTRRIGIRNVSQRLLAFGCGGHGGVPSFRLAQSQALVGTEEKRLVFANRAAYCAAVLVAIKPGNRTASSHGRASRAIRLIKEIFRIQVAIANKFKARPVKLVGAALGDDVDLGAPAAAVFRGGVARLDFELLNGIHGRQNRVLINGQVVVVYAIEKEVVGLLASAIDADGAALRGIL